LPPRALARLGDYHFYHGPGITCAVLSPDGKRAASASERPEPSGPNDTEEWTVLLWDTATGNRVRSMRGLPSKAHGLTFSPDGTVLAVNCGSDILLFEVESSRLLRRLRPFESSPTIRFSPDGKQIHGHRTEHDGVILSWDVITGEHRRRWNPPGGPSEWVKIGECVIDGTPSPDGKFVAWFLGRMPDSSTRPEGAVPPPPVPKREALVVADAATDKPLYRLSFKSNELYSFTFTADGRRFGTGDDKLTVWDTATGKELAAIEKTSAYKFALSPSHRRAVVLETDSRVRLWDLETQQVTCEILSGLSHINFHTLGNPQTFSADGQAFVLASHSTLRLFDSATGKERAASVHRTAVTPRFSPDGRTLITTCREAKCRWDISSATEPALLSRESRHAWEGSVLVLSHSLDGRIFLGRSGDRLAVQESSTNRVLCEIEGNRGGFFEMISGNSSRVLIWHHSTVNEPEIVRLYDAHTGKRTGEIVPKDWVDYPVFSLDGRYVAWADLRLGVRVYDGLTGELVRTLRSTRELPGDKCSDVRMCFSPEGEYLFVTNYFFSTEHKPIGNGTPAFPTRMFRVSDGKEVVRFDANLAEGHRAASMCAASSPDGRLFAITEGASGTIRLIELVSGKVRASLVGHRDGIRELVFSPDSKVLASGGVDNVVYLWDVFGTRTGKTVPDVGERELAGWWGDLASPDAERAGAAIAELVRAGNFGVHYLRARLSPAEAVDETRLARLLSELDAVSFPAREEASRELARFGERAEPSLRQALKDGATPEAGRRIRDLLDKLDRSVPSPDVLRAVRAIESLERIGTPEAVTCLEAIAKGSPGVRQTRDAKAALARANKP
jgi:WD40 repeat protein